MFVNREDLRIFPIYFFTEEGASSAAIFSPTILGKKLFFVELARNH